MTRPGHRFAGMERALAVGSGILSLAFGLFLVYQIGFVDGLFGPDPMGGHHPAEYFAESILNPNAVIVTGPGYTGPDGLSVMPDYRESLTVSELIDLVAYLKSLTGADLALPARTRSVTVAIRAPGLRVMPSAAPRPAKPQSVTFDWTGAESGHGTEEHGH